MIFNRNYFEKKFETEDPWSVSDSIFQLRKYKQQIILIKDLVREPVSVLEIGCAEGCHTAMLASVFPRTQIVAVDISSSAIARARKRCQNNSNISFIVGDIDRLLKQGGLPHQPYDVIIQSESLYYMFLNHVVHLRIKDYVHNLLDILKTGGIFFTCNSYAGITRSVVSVYYTIFDRLAEPVLSKTYQEWFDSKEAYWSYEIKTYRRPEKDYRMR